MARYQHLPVYQSLYALGLQAYRLKLKGKQLGAWKKWENQQARQSKAEVRAP